MGGTGAGRLAPLTGVSRSELPTGAGLRSLAVGIAFFCGPVVMVAAAVSARTAGYVDARSTVESRVRRYLEPARRAAAEARVPLALVLAVASVESAGRPAARSGAGAVGLMQLMPSTAAELALELREPAPRLEDPETSLRLGARYLGQQLRAFSEQPAARELALCAYNAGPGAVRRWIEQQPPPAKTATLGTWIPARYAETRAFVRRVTEWEEHWSLALAARGDAVPAR